MDLEDWTRFLNNPAEWPDDGTYEAFTALDEAVDSGRYDYEERWLPMATDEDKTITFTAKAVANINLMVDRTLDVGNGYGFDSEEYGQMARSLLHSLRQVVNLGGHIFGEDDLSLGGNSFISYGVIFFPQREGEQGRPLLGEWSVHS